MNTKINPRNGIRGLIALVALSAMLVLPAAAFGQTTVDGGGNCSPTDVQYAEPTDVLECAPDEDQGDDPGDVAGVSSAGSDPVDSGDELPFTGLDALTLLAVAAALTGTGLVLRRATSSGVDRS